MRRILFAELTLLACAAASAMAQPRVLVGPNILVSRGGNNPHTEPIVAAELGDERRLLGASIVSGDTVSGPSCRTYASFDGGSTWTTSLVPEQAEFGGADPQVSYGLHGTAYFSAIAAAPQPARGIYFYRSEDGGRTWGKGVNLGPGDHEEIAVDMGSGKYAGRVYAAMARAEKGIGIYLFHSDDDGRSFATPVLAAARPALGVNVTNLQLFSDGSLFVPYITFEIDLARAKASNSRGLEFVISRDGGSTFSDPRHIIDYTLPERTRLVDDYKNGAPVEITFPEFAIDRFTGKYRDRIYVVWTDAKLGPARLLFAVSDDRGQHWSGPRLVDPAIPRDAAQFQPAIAVNQEGVIGVEWFDTRNSRHGESFEAYFSASLDGGATFLPATRVSSAPSVPANAENLKPFAMPNQEKDSLSLYFLSPFNRWSGGGDYIGLTADAHGRFHAFWPDSRSGTYQIYTAVLTVAGADPARDPARLPANVTAKIELLFDPVVYDTHSREMTIPVRIRNVSAQTLYGPMTLEINGLVRPDLKRLEMEDLANVPEIVNAKNSKPGPGAIFDYSHALGTLEGLPPKGISEAVPWVLRFPRPFFTTFYVNASVQGAVAGK